MAKVEVEKVEDRLSELERQTGRYQAALKVSSKRDSNQDELIRLMQDRMNKLESVAQGKKNRRRRRVQEVHIILASIFFLAEVKVKTNSLLPGNSQGVPLRLDL